MKDRHRFLGGEGKGKGQAFQAKGKLSTRHRRQKEDMIGQYEWLGVNKEMVKSCEKGLGVIIWYFMVIIKLKISELC